MDTVGAVPESSQEISTVELLLIPVSFALSGAVAGSPVVHLSEVHLSGLKATLEPRKQFAHGSVVGWLAGKISWARPLSRALRENNNFRR
jgi:hypothetical protein